MEGSSEDSGGHSKHGTLHHTTLESRSGIGKTQLTPVLDQSENTASLLAAADEGNQSTHVIDMSAYVAPDMDEKTEQLLSMSIHIVENKDPFDQEERECILNNLSTPLHHYDNYNSIDEYMPGVRKGNILPLGRILRLHQRLKKNECKYICYTFIQ